MSGLAMPAIGRYVAERLGGEAPASPVEDFSAILALRFAVDELKANCLEAAAGDRNLSSRQLGDWLWNKTAGGAAFVALRALGQASEDERLNDVLPTQGGIGVQLGDDQRRQRCRQHLADRRKGLLHKHRREGDQHRRRIQRGSV
jgi:hypothetical protein